MPVNVLCCVLLVTFTVRGSEWDLVCSRTALLSTVQGSYMGGVFVGCLFWGWASDKFGRKPSIMIAAVIQICSSVAAAFSVNYIMFIFFRFIIAFSVSGVFECAFVLVMEIVSPELRTPMGIMTQFPFGLGVCILPAIAYFFRDWMPLQLAISVPCLVLLSYYWEIPESPRWLVQKKRFKEAKVILQKIAKANGNELPEDEEFLKMLEKLDDSEKTEEAGPVLTTSEKLKAAFEEVAILFATPNLRKRTLNIFYSWLVVAMVYYGLSFNSKNIGGDMYVSMFISGMAEVLACLAIIPALAKFGRVKIYSGGFIAGGLCCLAVAVMLWTMEPVGSYFYTVFYRISFILFFGLIIKGHDGVAADDHRHDGQVPHLRHLRPLLSLHRRALPHARPQRRRGRSLHLRAGGLGQRALHRGHPRQHLRRDPGRHLRRVLRDRGTGGAPPPGNTQQATSGDGGGCGELEQITETN